VPREFTPENILNKMKAKDRRRGPQAMRAVAMGSLSLY
jgi:hypothetical protein